MGTPGGPATPLAPSAGHCRASHKLHSRRWGAPARSLKATKHRAERQLPRSVQQAPELHGPLSAAASQILRCEPGQLKVTAGAEM